MTTAVPLLMISERERWRMKTCENCGSRVYGLGCVNCDEINYIEEQEMLTDQMIRDQEREDRQMQPLSET